MNERQVWEEWKNKLGVRYADTLADLWEELKSRDLLENVLTYQWSIEDLVDHSKETLRWWRKREGRTQLKSGGGNTKPVRVSREELELERQAALEEYLAMCAACDVDVYRFRQNVLEGELLSQGQARELLGSPAAAFMETRLFKEGKIPIVGHTAEVESYERDLVPPGVEQYTATLSNHPPGITRTVWIPTWPGTSNAEKHRLVVLDFPRQEGKIASREVWSNSLLGELTSVGAKLSERYRWQPAQAVWFVLTGEIPAVPSLTVTRSFPTSMYHSDMLITIEATPWVSPRTVKRAFRKAQIKAVGVGGRRSGEEKLKLLRFVIERIEPLGSEELGMLDDGEKPPGAPKGLWGLELVAQYPWYRRMPNGKEIVREWNETHPEWSYGDNTSRFWRDYHRIKKAVAFGPPYKW